MNSPQKLSPRRIGRMFEQAAFLLDVLGDDSFRAKAFESAARILKSWRPGLPALTKEIEGGHVKGIGPALKSSLQEIVHSGTFSVLDDLKKTLPPSFDELASVSGLGPKKLHVLLFDHKVQSLEDIETLCQTNQLQKIKGFGQKTETSILHSVEERKAARGKLLYFHALRTVAEIVESFGKHGIEIFPCGAILRADPILNSLEFRAEKNQREAIESFLPTLFPQCTISTEAELKTIFVTPAHLRGSISYQPLSADERRPFLPLVTRQDIRGIIHAHSTYSDGEETLRDLALLCKERGLEYLAISDHSQSAAYANGLRPQDVLEQRKEVDALNEELAPFRIFHGIESDILRTGELDYPPEILGRFDFVIASVHSSMDLSEDEMTARICNALENPYITILGHPTGRLLIEREPYACNLMSIIECAARNSVAIEFNTNPHRLDLDVQYHQHAAALGIPVPYSPDLHSLQDLEAMEANLAIAARGGLLPAQIPSCWSVEKIDQFFSQKRLRREKK